MNINKINSMGFGIKFRDLELDDNKIIEVVDQHMYLEVTSTTLFR